VIVATAAVCRILVLKIFKMDFCCGVKVWKTVILDQVQRSLNKDLEEIYLIM